MESAENAKAWLPQVRVNGNGPGKKTFLKVRAFFIEENAREN